MWPATYIFQFAKKGPWFSLQSTDVSSGARVGNSVIYFSAQRQPEKVIPES